MGQVYTRRPKAQEKKKFQVSYMHRTPYRLGDGLTEIIKKIKNTERQGDYFSKREGRSGYPPLHQVFSPQKKQSLEHATRYSLSAT